MYRLYNTLMILNETYNKSIPDNITFKYLFFFKDLVKHADVSPTSTRNFPSTERAICRLLEKVEVPSRSSVHWGFVRGVGGSRKRGCVVLMGSRMYFLLKRSEAGA